MAYDPPSNWLQILTRFDAFTGCGDLIFSSHTLISINMALTINHYSKNKTLKVVFWSLVLAMILALIAGRHHYSVDVVVACYVVPLIWHYLLSFPDPDFPISGDTLDEEQLLN